MVELGPSTTGQVHTDDKHNDYWTALIHGLMKLSCLVSVVQQFLPYPILQQAEAQVSTRRAALQYVTI